MTSQTYSAVIGEAIAAVGIMAQHQSASVLRCIRELRDNVGWLTHIEDVAPESKWIDSVRQRASPRMLVRKSSTYAICVSFGVSCLCGVRATRSIVPQAVMRIQLLPTLTERRSGLSLVLFQSFRASVLMTCVLRVDNPSVKQVGLSGLIDSHCCKTFDRLSESVDRDSAVVARRGRVM
jgi:hypothetical protein